jgi:hypothetical protein
MKNRFMSFVLVLFLAGAVVQAGLWDPAIINQSFEWVEGGTHPTSGWGYVIDDWFEYPDSDASVYWEAGASISMPECDGDLWVGFQTGGTVYQAIGTVDDGVTYVVTALIGDRPDDVFGTGAISLYASDSEDDGADDVELASFATLLDSVEVTMSDGTFVTEYIREVEVLLSVGTGHAGEILWLQLEDIEGKDYFDNIRIENVKTAYNPEPADGVINVPLDQVLSWYTGPDPADPTQPNPLITKHFVYMNSGNDDDPNLVLVNTIDAGSPPAPTAQYTPPAGLSRDGVYLWRVDEGIGDYPEGDPNNIEGNVWTFAAVTSKPIFEAGLPADVLVEAGEDATFVVSAMNPYSMDYNGMTYAWKKVGDPGTVLSTTTTLEIPDAQIANEGQYYCTVTVVDPAVNESADSRNATLTIKRLLGHWPFDRSLEDVVAGNDAVYTGPKEKYDSGILGNAIEFDSSANHAATITTAMHTSLSYTLCWWENAAEEGTTVEWESMIASGASAGYEVCEFDRYMNYQYAMGFNWDTYGYSDEYPRGVWYMHAVTYDSSEGKAVWYLNGSPEMDFYVSFEGFDSLIYIGNSRDMGQAFNGLIDDLKFYSYPLTAYEVATMYYEVTGESVCAGNPEYDLTDDCKVNIDDLAVFLSDWMDCNLYPTCIN